MADKYRPGDWLARCDMTGFRQYASDCRMQWNGLFVRSQSFELRNAQDFVRGRPDDQTVPIARPESDPVFLDTNDVQPGDL